MAEVTSTGGKRYKPYVPSETGMTEFTVKALLYGLVMAVVLGAANAYLGLKAGMTIAATYPAAVISMAVLRITFPERAQKGHHPRGEHRPYRGFHRGVGGGRRDLYDPGIRHLGRLGRSRRPLLEATAIMMLGGVLGVLFVTLLRRVMVEDVELPFPESVAAGEIHKAGRTGGTGAVYLMLAAIVGAAIQSMKQMTVFASSWEKFIPFGRGGVRLGPRVAPWQARVGSCSPRPESARPTWESVS